MNIIYKLLRNKLILLIFLFVSFSSFAQTDSTITQKFAKHSDISGQWFLAYKYEMSKNINSFSLKRGYFTVKTKLSPNIVVRYTQDITLDKEGTDAGNVEIRIKYLYMKFTTPETNIFKGTYAEIGLVHRPWIDFEQKINPYRVQGKMFSERHNALTSADFGITIGGNIAGKLSSEVQDRIGSKYPGKYGSFSFGIYNGGGYHEIEYNNNKVFEGRLSLRPSPNLLPGVQISYMTSFGKINSDSINSNFNIHLFYLSSQGKYHNFSAQYLFGKGNYTGNCINNLNKPLNHEGISFFGEIFIPKTEFSIFSRYDFFGCQKTDYIKKEVFISGFSYHFLQSKIVLFYETEFYSGYRNNILEIALDVVF